MSDVTLSERELPIRVDSRVDFNGMRPQASFALSVAMMIAKEQGILLVLRSMCDGKHSRKSLHYQGNAFDLWWAHIEDDNARRRKFYGALAVAIGSQYDVVDERTHVHVEWQPKRG